MKRKQKKSKAKAKSSEPKTHQPYDKFLRHAMERPEVAKDFICQFYPNGMAKYFKFDNLHLCQGTFVDKAYQKQETDLLFELSWKDTPVLCYCLIEHFSEPDKMAPFRIVKYMVAIMERYRKENGGDKLPLVLPLIFYPRDKNWPYSTNFRDLIQAPSELIDQVWSQSFPIAQGVDMQEDEMMRHRWSSALAWIMNHSMQRDVLAQLDESPILMLLQEFDESGGMKGEYVIELMSHILYTNSISRDKLKDYLHKRFSPTMEEKVMTLAQRLHDEGWDQGIQQGMQQGELKGKLEGEHNKTVEFARRLLREGFSGERAAQLAGLPQHEVELLDTK